MTGRKKKEVLIAGSVFCATVFVGYTAAGFGLFQVFRRLPVFSSAANGFKFFLAAVLILLAIFSAYDAYVFSRGAVSSAMLKMPILARRKIHEIARGAVRGPALFAGLIVLGLAVTIFEFSCTGQVYLPVIMHLARTGADGRAFFYLVLYNAVFLLPLLSVFVAAYFGLASKKIEVFFRDRLAVVKLGTAVMFTAFSILTLLF
jgi:cytochrome c biogenesis protein CcdA